MFLSFSIRAQDTNKVSQDVIEFWKIMKKYQNMFEMNNLLIKKINRKEANKIARLYYNAIANDPLGFNRFTLMKFKEWEKRRKAGSLTLHDIKPGIKVRRLKEVISSYYGETFTKVISIPYYLRIKIIDIKHEFYKSKKLNMNFPKIVLSVEVQEVIKGSKMFKKGEKININILSNWINSKHEFFKIESNYFVPIKLWNCSNYIKKKFSLDFLNLNSDSIYPIDKKNVIKNISDFFLDKTKYMNWDEFKEKFVKRFVSF